MSFYYNVSPDVMCYKRGDLLLVLDKSKVIPDDPGADTPAMVYQTDKAGTGKSYASATYWCATSEEVLCGSGNKPDRELSKAEVKWLIDLDDKLTDFLYR